MFSPRHLLTIIFALASLMPLAADTKTGPDFSIAGFFPVPGSQRQVYDFDPGWRFLKADAAGAEAPAFDDSSWQKVNLPNGLEILPENASGMRNYQGPAWYRKHFHTPALMGNQLILYFEAVMGKCKVWVNGKEVATHFGGYLPFAVDITAVVPAGGGDNVVAVRADNSDDPTFPPGLVQKDLDFAYLGGIYRDVYLIQTGKVRITLPEMSSTVAGGGVFVATKEITAGDATLEVRTEVENKGPSPAPVSVRTVLEDGDHHDVLMKETTATVTLDGTAQLTQTLNPKSPHLWTPNDPYLYFIRTDLVQNGTVIDSLRTRFGIRLFELKDREGLYINHRPIGYKINGANRHQDYVYVGNALPKSGQWRDAKMLREGGCMFIRAAHYPMSPAFLDACDVLGLLVTDATPGWHFYPQDAAHAQAFDPRCIEDAHNMVRRDRNRPAMLFWETTLNETLNMPADFLSRLNKAAHEEFPFPGFFTAADSWDALPAGMDLPYFHEGDGHKPAPTEGQPFFQREYGDWVDNFWIHNSPVRVKREWGEHALNVQAQCREQDLNGLYNTAPNKIGGALWAGIDHQRGYNPDPFWGGLLDLYRVPRYSYYFYKSQYDPGLKIPGIETGPMISICHELTWISEPDVVIYTNCQQVHLTWLGKDFGTQGPDRSRHEPHPPIIFKNVFDIHAIGGPLNHDNPQHRLQMVAEGLIDGKVVCREEKQYPARTAGLHLVVDGQSVPLQADGSDFVPVHAYVVDEFGTTRVLESAYVHFQVEGPGEIIGGEANQANPMKTQFGVATALVRAGLTPGMLHVTATSDGLKSDAVDIPSVAPSLPLLPSTP